MKIRKYFYKLIPFGLSALVIIGTEYRMVLDPFESFIVAAI
ncbi:hypothetical protein [Alkalibacterium gilvum]|jgi:hypothetical protein